MADLDALDLVVELRGLGAADRVALESAFLTSTGRLVPATPLTQLDDGPELELVPGVTRMTFAPGFLERYAAARAREGRTW